MLPMLGDSYQLAFCRLQSMEKKFAIDEALRIAYHRFLEKYESLCHMGSVSSVFYGHQHPLTSVQQIWVHPDDRKYQHILFRKDPSEPVHIYQLKTVTYGLASSPYQATRVLNQLAKGERYPLAVHVIKNGTYVDDVLIGDDDEVKLAETCPVLRKWATNNNTVLASVPSQLWETKPELEFDRAPVIKTLGLLWLP